MSAVTINRRFVDRVVLITGGGSGIGEAMALAFSQEGARVVVVDRDAAGASRVASSIVASGGLAVAETADVALASDMKRVVDGAVERWGRINVLCNNAGIGIAAVCHETSEADWDLTMAIDLKGVFLGCKYAIPHMLRQGGGVICNTSSVAGQVGVLNRAAYCSAKAGVLGLTKSIAIDYAGHNIRCNALLPGTVDSPWIGKVLAQHTDPVGERARMEARQPVGRMGRPEEIAQAALYLCSDDASYATGTGLVIDGGLTAR